MNKNALYSLVIPVFEEEECLEITIKAIIEQFISLDILYEFILVDDGSTDNTWEVIKNLSSQYPTIRGIRFSRNFGKEYALCAGLEAANGNAVIIMDADLQHPPNLIPKMIEIWNQEPVDIVEAVKVNRGQESFFNKVAANLFYTVLEKLSGQKLKGASDYKLLDRKVVDAWLQFGERNLFFRSMISWLGFERIQVPFEVQSRFLGKSKWSVINLVKLSLTGITSFSSIPLHFVTLIGILFLLFSIVLLLQTLFVKLSGNAVSGFSTVIILLLTVGSLIMLSLGIIGEYLARIYEEIKNRPRYVIRERIK